MFLKDFLEKTVGPWIKRRDNPHEVTAEQVDAYTKAEIDDLIKNSGGGGGTATITGSELFPIYAYGPAGDDVDLGITTNGLDITFPELPAFFNGTSATCPKTTITALSNVISYVTVSLVDGVGVYNTSVGRPITNKTTIVIGTITVNDGKIVSNTITNVRGVFLVDLPY